MYHHSVRTLWYHCLLQREATARRGRLYFGRPGTREYMHIQWILSMFYLRLQDQRQRHRAPEVEDRKFSISDSPRFTANVKNRPSLWVVKRRSSLVSFASHASQHVSSMNILSNICFRCILISKSENSCRFSADPQPGPGSGRSSIIVFYGSRNH